MTPNFCKTIGEVIVLAEDVLNRPALPSRLDKVTALSVVVEGESALFVEGGNPMRSEVAMLLEALANIEAERSDLNKTRALEFSMIAGALLPMVRRCMDVALHLGRRGPSTSDGHDFKSGRRA